MLMNNLPLALALTSAFYIYNANTGRYEMDIVQYGLFFIAVMLGLAVLNKYYGLHTPQDKMKSFLQMVGAVPEDPNGEPEVPCYHVPYKVVRSQYGDRALLAGYNEHLGTYESGGSDQGSVTGFAPREACMGVTMKMEQLVNVDVPPAAK